MATPNQLWGTNTLGGYMYSDKLSHELRMAVQPACKFRQFCDGQDATQARNPKGEMLGHGDKFTWDTYSDVETQGGTLSETANMPSTNFTVKQFSLTIREWGNSIGYSSLLDDFSYHPIRKIINKTLKNDARKAFDGAAFGEFNKTKLRVVPTGGTATDSVVLTTDGTATATNDVSLRTGHIKAITDLMKMRDIPPYVGDDFVCIASPDTLRPIKNTLETLHQYTEQGLRLIHNAEVGRYEQVRFVEQTHINAGGAADSTTYTAIGSTGADPWDKGKSSWAFFFGEDTVIEGIILPEEMRGQIPNDFGRKRAIAWYGLEGFGISQSEEDQARIIKWDSAS